MHVRLLVLGVVYRGESHGYEIKALAKLWGVEEWANIGDGSIYHALGALERERMIVQGRTEKPSRRPARTTYRITEAGGAAFLELLRNALRSFERAEVDLGLAFATALPPEERTALLNERLAKLRTRATANEANQLRARTELAHAPWIEASVDHQAALLKAEIAWTEDVAKRVGEFPSATERDILKL